MVENSSDEFCWHPVRSKHFFESFGLDFVPMTNLGKFEDPKKALEEVNQKVMEAPLAREEEGSVLYFVQDGKVVSI